MSKDTNTTIEEAKEKGYDLGKMGSPNEVTPSAEALDMLSQVRINLVRAYPFMSFLVMGANYTFTDSLPTMAATTMTRDGAHVYINEDFMMKELKNVREVGFVIAHELLHIYLEHVGRQVENNYHGPLWNVATDYVINSFLTDMCGADAVAVAGLKSMERPEMGLYDEKFAGWSADKVYHYLLEQNDGDADAAAEANGGADGEGNTVVGTGDGAGKGGQRPFDAVSSENVSDAKRAEGRQRMAASMEQDSRDRSTLMGTGAGGLLRQLQDLLTPKIPWGSVLREFVTETTKRDYTYSRISRRSTASVVFPTMTGDHINVAFGVDTSGSMSTEDLRECMTEMAKIITDFDSWDLALLSCDTNPHLIGSYSSDEGDDISTIDMGLVGGGGTDMNPMIAFSNEELESECDMIPNVIIIATDGYVPDITTIDEIPVIFIITSAGSKNFECDEAHGVIHMNDVKEMD